MQKYFSKHLEATIKLYYIYISVQQNKNIMDYLMADIHTRINTKANTIVYYRRTQRHLIARVAHRDTDIAYSRFGMMLKPEQYSEPRNAGNPSY